MLVPLDRALLEGDPHALALRFDLPHGEPWGWALAQALLSAHALARTLARAEPPGLLALVEEELARLRELRERLRERHPLADLGVRPASSGEWAALKALEEGGARDLARVYREHGRAPFVCHAAFVWNDRLEPVPHPEPAELGDLVGYAHQKKELVRLAERFLSGKPVPPTLLYGARGSGKSTAARALLSAFAERGLRFVELFPEGLFHLPELYEELRGLPYRFVLFLDDLALDAGDERTAKLKSLLEGSLFARPANTWILATTNRRNLVRETWADREGPAAWDTEEELRSLADRFGVVITFPPFDRERYLEAVAHHLGRPLDERTQEAALRFAAHGRGFSGRTARHFAELFG